MSEQALATGSRDSSVRALHEETGSQAGVTQQLCAYLAGLRFSDMPGQVAHESCRGVLDWLGCALAGSTHPTIDKLVGVLQEIDGKPQATVFGRKLKLGLLDAPLANGQMGHVLDYDDTHMVETTLVHTSSPILAALFALAARKTVSGERFLLAYAAGFEAGIRTGRASPGHLAGGWHLTGTLGSIAAGVAAGKLLGLDARQLTHALAVSATQAAGMQQNRGTMCKSFRKGQARALVIAGGRRYEAVIEHASGTADNPMSDAAIEAKFLANAEPVIGKERAHRVAGLVWKMDGLNDVSDIAALCA